MVTLQGSTYKLNLSEFTIESYDEMCEEIAMVNRIITLDISYPKIALLIFLNILTALSINLFLIWFPKLKLYLLYSTSPIEKAKYVGLFAKGKLF
jgi:hypothetical protein